MTTFTDGSRVACAVEGFCYYHSKMKDGLLDPCTDDFSKPSVVEMGGKVIWSRAKPCDKVKGVA